MAAYGYLQVAEVLLCSSVPTDDVLTPNSKQQLLLDLLQTLLNKVSESKLELGKAAQHNIGSC